MWIGEDHLEYDSDGVTRRLHHVWLRDNCGCAECRVDSTGERHLQDVYMEYDDFMARRRVTLGIHKPSSPTPAVAS